MMLGLPYPNELPVLFGPSPQGDPHPVSGHMGVRRRGGGEAAPDVCPGHPNTTWLSQL